MLLVLTLALKTYSCQNKIASVYRLSVLRIARALRTMSEDGVCVIAETLLIELFDEEVKDLVVEYIELEWNQNRTSAKQQMTIGSAEEFQKKEREYPSTTNS